MLTFYNSLTHKEEEFQPIEPGKVRIYSCGPTVYNYAHIGNFRSFLFADTVRRYLKYKGYQVTHVMNITDVDDKTIRDSQKEGKSLRDFTEFYTKAFFEDIETLNIEKVEYYPKATEHIEQMVALIKRLIANGHTYEADGSIYFRIATLPHYGRMAQLDAVQLQGGASGRLDVDEYDKEDVRDFVLWKAWRPEDGEVYWDTELGRGRPGWHIECSAMSMHYLGEHFDIHTGGIDLLFPHHENEIAQSEGATKKRFVNYWLHCKHLLVNNAKMSKSLGNVYTLRDLLARGYKPKAIRYTLMSIHYRQQQNFTFEGLEAAENTVQRLLDFMRNLREASGKGTDIAPLLQEAAQKFEEGMDDDLNISVALSAIFDFVKEMNRLMAQDLLSRENALEALALMRRFDTVLGVLEEEDITLDQQAQRLLEEREAARKIRDFQKADALRDQIQQMGYIIEDTPTGPRVKKK